MPRWPERSFEDRLLDKVPEASDACMEWTGAIKSNGYGHIGSEGKTVLAHRAMWELSNGPIPDGMFVLHACDNRRCVNPKHLFLGDGVANVRDMIAKGRRRLNGKPCATITSADRAGMRAAYAQGAGTLRQIASMFGVSYGAARNAALGLVA